MVEKQAIKEKTEGRQGGGFRQDESTGKSARGTSGAKSPSRREPLNRSAQSAAPPKSSLRKRLRPFAASCGSSSCRSSANASAGAAQDLAFAEDLQLED